MAFTRMDLATEADWAKIGRVTGAWQAGMPGRVRAMLLQSREIFEDGSVDQLQHGLQTATRALRSGASEELVVAALCHDMANVISVENHGPIVAEILKPYVSSDVYGILRTHQDFQGRYSNALFGKDPEERRRHRRARWYGAACRFSDEWDQASFDPGYDTLPLEHFEPMIERVFREPRRDRAREYREAAARRWRIVRGWMGRGGSGQR
ncbi:MAG: metal-dependent phosphohydrolase [Acidobacteriota bacterium]